MDLQPLLPELVPKAIAWAKIQSEHIRSTGYSLNEKGFAIARQVGVLSPELVRVRYVSQLPVPDDPELRKVALGTGLLGPGMVGLTLGHGIFVVDGYGDVRLMSHELRHVQQYEAFGSIEAFMPVYLAQIASVGYRDAPLEQDARAHEVLSDRADR
ncbi:hypothetical protein [Ramlibacter montanisoli]|uniref:DUF4157 domain-containing protein n=1 Tax=Ramlibacter montanisoli TaxID=2732512 RepID=A0A849KA97_9BURK|nr:hypothetical protein [Ramlibacter montanisoli]NNU42426.1 hypothetical protein [Ramlibacter montanisoli]